MKNIFKTILALGISLGSFSCTPYLDMKPTDNVSDKVIWQTTANAEYYVNYIYDYVYVVVMDQADSSTICKVKSTGCRAESRVFQ